MKALILTEGGKDIGFGHIVRCVALCEAFEKKGITAELMVNIDEDTGEIIGGRDYRSLNWLKESDRLLEMVNRSEIVVVDSYLADKSLYNRISDIAGIPVYLDDTRRLEYPRGIVINGSFYAEDLNYPKKEGVKYLLGIEYAIFRKEFWKVSETKIGKDIKNVMIAFGGADTKNMTSKILDFLNKSYPDLQKLVVVGKSSSAEEMKETMLRSDIAISSGGQTLYELIRVGVPVIGICVAENQRIGLEKLQKMDLIEYIGSHADSYIEAKLIKSINRLKGKTIREERSKRGRELVDGKGCERLMDGIVSVSTVKNRGI